MAELRNSETYRPGPAQVASFGRQVAGAAGYDVDDPGVDWAAYGDFLQRQHRLDRPPDPTDRRFRLAGARPRPSGPPAPPAPPAPSRGRYVRLGGFEFGYADPASTSRQHPRRAGERTTGRFRRRDTGPWLRERDRHRRRRGGR